MPAADEDPDIPVASLQAIFRDRRLGPLVAAGNEP
jgi:hypothetical protein